MGKSLQDVGIKHGMTLTLVRMSQTEIFELLDMVGDESELNRADSQFTTKVRVAFTSENTCILIRETHSRHITGSFTWDICRGNYGFSEKGDLAVCIWSQCYRRRRGGME